MDRLRSSASTIAVVALLAAVGAGSSGPAAANDKLV